MASCQACQVIVLLPWKSGEALPGTGAQGIERSRSMTNTCIRFSLVFSLRNILARAFWPGGYGSSHAAAERLGVLIVSFFRVFILVAFMLAGSPPQLSKVNYSSVPKSLSIPTYCFLLFEALRAQLLWNYFCRPWTFSDDRAYTATCTFTTIFATATSWRAPSALQPGEAAPSTAEKMATRTCSLVQQLRP
ncbi:uncharacterized protein BDZ99DRAFT_514350 [Mytilinidion resinicola]|uniref:Uncharacterized protein n=1 Tax=Mytilinidion resinicola TaxID=574789 RepID=A0A6A6Z656_9PEZI|nr:uncharacterized protein BDZ99DRAFT_514350 [Mytilinidion resinicola]KAF2815705.1 hypothetical protein BDZ99DRAFT_514350 [Mytilinidion resinicola]